MHDFRSINLLNFTDKKGNSSFIRWAVVLSGSVDCISNVATLNIIAQAVEHRLQLHDTFGGYRLLNRNIKAPS
ncbi:hypothetical protein NC652_025278 [Populus alba x Populus x berolinensis]|nr:hypothetical protein NC652_025278 [Populus alba x Populus x berolinensis]